VVKKEVARQVLQEGKNCAMYSAPLASVETGGSWRHIQHLTYQVFVTSCYMVPCIMWTKFLQDHP